VFGSPASPFIERRIGAAAPAVSEPMQSALAQQRDEINVRLFQDKRPLNIAANRLDLKGRYSLERFVSEDVALRRLCALHSMMEAGRHEQTHILG
jgi:hypothetical protein